MTVTKEKERRKRKCEEMERRREKSNGCTLSFIMATLEITLSKIRLDTYISICIQERNEKKK